jgi:predicted Ser/Thr protein kinase
VTVKEHVAIALPSAGTEAEPARAFLQDRIGLWALWVFVLAGGFYVINIVTWPLAGDPSHSLVTMLTHPASTLHLAATLIFGAASLLRRARPLPLATLRTIDLAVLIGSCLIFALMGTQIGRMRIATGQDGVLGAYAGLLAALHTVAARAIAVPSTATRTAWATTVALLPIPVAVAWVGGSHPSVWLNSAIWCALSIAIATAGSRTIFGLRSEAARVRRLGQYALEERIGAGGMGVVYRASHAMLRRPTAIKLLPPDRAGEASLVRFEREVQLTAQLSHPNTVAIYDYGRTPDGVFYYAMEYLDGINLDDLVRGYGAQPPGRVISILEQVCGALAEAHGRGLIHRDIKPANIILTERGGEPDVAKVVDFGLVKPLSRDDPSLSASASCVLTGTPLYMSPETMTSPDSADPRSDLYAVGAVGYFLLTGKPVFDGASVFEIIGHHLHTPPVPPSQRVTHAVPADLEALILKCLRKSPAERPPHARALRDELRRSSAAEAWTSEDAAAWWRGFRNAGSPLPPPDPGTDPSSAITVMVDVDDRLTQPVTR